MGIQNNEMANTLPREDIEFCYQQATKGDEGIHLKA
jgi:hypothetical protein